MNNIASMGGRTKVALYGSVSNNESYRKEKWRKWWSTKGKLNEKIVRLQRAKEIRIPSFDEDLAEFVGIMIGDGGVAPYHIAITLNSKTENRYAVFICKLIKKLFDVVPRIYKRKNSHTIDVVVQRKKLVEFCQILGLKKGSKVVNQVTIPEWITRDNRLSTACMRGLIDTDGTVFLHSYSVHGKTYRYKKISLSSSSYVLLQSAEQTLKKLGFGVRITRNRREVVMENQKYVKKYIHEVGTHNPLRLRQIRKVAPNGKATVC